jgi:hypothetical protein
MSALRTTGLLLALLAFGACGTLPPYSDISEQPLQGLSSVKVRGAVHEGMDLTRDNPAPTGDATEVVDRLSSWAIEFERSMGAGWTASFAVEARRYEFTQIFPDIRANQVRGGVRRYFGDRALTAFACVEGVYGTGFDFGDVGYEGESYLGWAAGGGLNLALNEEFSFEMLVLYEGMPDSKAVDFDGGPTVARFNASGPVAYLAIGWHF